MATDPRRSLPGGLASALPFWLSLLFVPIIAAAALWGGWWLALPPVYGFVVITILDAASGLNTENPNPEGPSERLFWYRLVTLIWLPVQMVLIYGALWWVSGPGEPSLWAKIALFYGIGVASGAVGIVYAHEMMHQKSTVERWMADLLLGSVLYSHFRSEHLQVHHRYVGTPRDPVTARYNEGFWRYFLRVLAACPGSAWRAERAMLARKGLAVWHASNPFWRYAALQAVFLALALAIGGWLGLALFLWQAFIAVLHLELTNYIEHYGLTRKYLGDGRYEHVQPRHSWNAAHRVSNWLLINLQRHSDHHYKPERRFPLLQTHPPAEAPQLPYGYPAMVMMAAVPPLWRRVMNPRVRAWRRQFYPEITDWGPYKAGTTPMPRGAV